MVIKIKRDDLIRLKGHLETSFNAQEVSLNSEQSHELTYLLIEQLTSKSPSGLFSNEEESSDETT